MIDALTYSGFGILVSAIAILSFVGRNVRPNR